MNDQNSLVKPFKEAYLDQCEKCPYLKGEYCSFFNAFINDCIELDSIPFSCPLPDFQFDGEVLKWS